MIWDLLLLNIIYALVFPLGKIAVDTSTTPAFLTAFRMLLGSIIVLGFQWKFNKSAFSLPRNYIWPLFIGAFFCYYLTNALELWALEYISPTKVCILYNFFPFVTVFFQYIIFKIRLSLLQWVGLAAGLLGSLPILFLRHFEATTLVPHSTLSNNTTYFYLPELSVICSTILYAYGWIYIQRLLTVEKYDYNMANGVAMAFAAGISLFHSRLIDTWQPVPVFNVQSFFIYATGLTLLFNVFYNSFYCKMLKVYSLALLSFTSFLDPLFTAFFDWLLLGNTIQWYFYPSFALISVGFYCFYKDEKNNNRNL